MLFSSDSAGPRTHQPRPARAPRHRRLAFQELEGRRLLSLSNALAEPRVTGDFDRNDRVEVADYVLWRDSFGQTGEGLAADANCDGVVDLADFTLWRDNLGAEFVNTPPVAVDDALDVNHGETAVVTPAQLLGNDDDPDGGPLTITAVAGAVGGTVEFENGLIFFTPSTHGPGSFEYTVSDGDDGQTTAAVTLTQLNPIHGQGDEQRGAEHAALFSLIDARDVTTVAVQSGAWSDASIWSTGQVPGAGDRVLVHNSVDVVYDALSDVPLDWLRVDGTLTFGHDVATRVVVETLAVDPRGTINIGTAENPIAAGVTAEVLIDTTGGALSQAEDPTLIGRGFISHGRTNIYGAEKAEHTVLLGDAFAGDAFIELVDASAPVGWRVGDTLLLVGTEADAALLGPQANTALYAEADANNTRFRDELLEVTGFETIGGRVRVTFNNVTNAAAVAEGRTTLLWDHARPDGETFDADELSVHVANLTRNVVVRSSDPTVDTQQRGHFMVMHNRNAEIHHAQFRDLGRTDKRLVVDDPAAIGNFDGSPGGGTNPRGRYGLHLHRMGANSLDGAAAVVTGNVVWGTPGWGIVHHDSHAVLEDNVVFDVVGAGIVAEDGNELGLWRNNLVVKLTGSLENNFDDGPMFATLRGPRFDLGFFGSGYWVQGGGFGIRLEDNTAGSTNAAGFDLVHNVDGLANVEQISVDLIADPVVRQAIADAGFEFVTPNNIPTRGADGLTVYNSFRGIHTWLHNRDSGDMEGAFTFPTFLGHEFRSVIENYTVWGVRSGVQNFYSTRFDFVNGLVVGDVDNPVPYIPDNDQQANNLVGAGISHNHEEANKITFDGLRLEGFEYGFQVFSPVNSQTGEVTPYATSELLNSSLANVDHAFLSTNGSNPLSQLHRFSDLFVIDGNSTFNTLGAGSNLAPVAAFGATAGEGISLVLDAAAAFDPDPSPTVRAGDDGIVAYSWDLDNDGEYGDAYGRVLTLNFDTPGDYTIGLMVWDDDGETATTSQSVTASSVAYSNTFVDADFSSAGPFEGDSYLFWSGRRGDGWIAREVARNPAGFAEIDSPQFGLGELGQIVRDQGVRRGVQSFSFDVRNQATAGFPESLRLRLFGVDGQWALDDLGGTIGPVSAMPDPNAATLLDVQLGAQSIPNWQTQSFDVDLGAQGYEYLVIYIDYQGYEYAQGDYFSFDNFTLTGPAPAAASVVEAVTERALSRSTTRTVSLAEAAQAPAANELALLLIYEGPAPQEDDELFVRSPTPDAEETPSRDLDLAFENLTEWRSRSL